MLLIALMWGFVGFILVTCSHHSPSQQPWFGRGKNLPPLPYRVVVGPVDLNRGIDSILEMGMKRSEVVKKLGEPTVRAMTTEEALREGLWDPEDVLNEFYDGFFAWVQYDRHERINQIAFDLSAFHEKFKGEQQVALQYRGRTALFGRYLSKNEVINLMHSQLGLTRLRIEHAQIIVLNTGVSLDFDADNHLSRIFIINDIAQK